MSNTLVQRGDTIDHVLTAAKSSGDPIAIGALVGICQTDGAIGDTVAVAITGVHEMPKLNAAVIAKGEKVALDISAGSDGEVDDGSITPAAGDITNFGVAVEAKGATTSETIKVRLSPGSGVVN